MRVLHVVHGYPPNVGGTQRVIQRLSEELVADHGDEVTVFTTNAYSNYHFWHEDVRVMPAGVSEAAGVEVRRFAVFNRFSRGRLRLARAAYRLRLPGNDWARALHNGPLVPGLGRAIRRHPCDLVVASAFPLLHMHTALAAGRRSGRPVVLIGGLHAEDVWGFDRPMIYSAARRADAYVAYTQFERDYLAARGVPAERIAVTGAGVDPAPLERADGDRFRRRLGLGAAPIVAFVGQQAEHKGIDDLLAALPAVRERFPDARLVVAGKPTRFSRELRRRVERMPADAGRSVTIVDEPTEEAKNDLLAACDLLALPSRHEAFGLVLLEAWACGKPVVAARIGALASVVDEGRDGLLAAPGDAAELAVRLVRLLADAELRRRLGEAGRRKALESFTWPRVTERVRAVYRRAVEDYPARSR